MNFLAFDIEAANGYKLSSICSIGIVICDESFNILRRENIWINPKTKYNLNGTRKNVGIDLHLDKKLLEASPDFRESYEKIKSLLSDRNVTVVGHAVESDVRMLNAACKEYKLPSIDFSFICSQLLYRLYKGEKEVKALCKIAAELGMEFDEHNSESDAWMSLMTLKYLCKENALTVKELLDKYRVRIGNNKNFEITRTVTMDGAVGKKKVTQAAIDQIKAYLKTKKSVSSLFAGKSFSIARSIELSGSDKLYKLLDVIAKNGGKYTARLLKSNVYVKADEPTEQDRMREKRVVELEKQGIIVSYAAEQILNQGGAVK